MTIMKRISSRLAESTPRAKLFLARSPDKDLAMPLKSVSLPVVTTRAVAVPLTMLELMKAMFGKPVITKPSAHSSQLLAKS